VLEGALLLASGGGAQLTSYAPVLVPVATLFTGWLAYLGVKRGSRIEDSQQRARNKLDERVQTLNELNALSERLEAENARLRDSRDGEAARHRTELDRLDAHHQAAEDRCRRQVERLLQELETLRSVVTSEIAKAAAANAAGDAAAHVELHDQATPEGAP
jgi:predicted nuclease with TOPRIM domain